VLVEPTIDRRTRRREASKAEILDAAWTLVREHGLAGLSLRDLAGRVGMKAPSLYSYFASKHEIYDAMFAQGCRAYLARLQALPSTGDAAVDMKAGSRAFVEFCVEDPARYQLLFQRTIPGFEPSPESYAVAVEILDTLRSRLAGFGVTKPEHVDLLTAINTGLAAQQLANDPGGDRWIRLVDDAVDMYLALARPRSPRTRSRS
jgi:AcrR family transcriptional regulator